MIHPLLGGRSFITFRATPEYPRHSEADVLPLKDGRLLLVWGRKLGGDDSAPGDLVAMVSEDQGESWGPEVCVVRERWGAARDVMSVSLCRTPRGIHLFFLGRDPVPTEEEEPHGPSRVYQMISADEGGTWSEPEEISQFQGFNVLNNARVIRTTAGRLLAPISYVPGSIFTLYEEQAVHTLYSDDDGRTWHASNQLSLEGIPLMEPGVAECSDSSIYMVIRTKTGFLYEARSTDGGATWAHLKPSPLPSAEAPGTVVRHPESGHLWMFWCNTPYTGKWHERHDIAVAVSKDNGVSWGGPITVEHNPKHSYGYISVLFLPETILITYYDWPLESDNPAAGIFNLAEVRQRILPRKALEKALGEEVLALRKR